MRDLTVRSLGLVIADGLDDRARDYQSREAQPVTTITMADRTKLGPVTSGPRFISVPSPSGHYRVEHGVQ